ncbi:hypothetical protein [Streptomyces sp. NEAU-H3]|nr:hypothetical protein [Streptomyces sp. NEAU-H3]
MSTPPATARTTAPCATTPGLDAPTWPAETAAKFRTFLDAVGAAL